VNKFIHSVSVLIGSAAAVLISTSSAHALTWNLNATLPSGATVTGSFDYSNDAYSNVNVTLQGTFGTVNYNTSSVDSTSDNDQLYLTAGGVLTSGNRYLEIFNIPDFWDNSIVVDIQYTTGLYEGVTESVEASSGPTSSVPFDIPGGATIPAVGGLLALGAMRKVRKKIALNTRASKPLSQAINVR
jgi:hypothetical protein